MYFLILILHILVCFTLMAVVLMQSGKGRGLSGALGGGGGNQTVFGGRGAVDFLGKATWILGGAFMVTSLTLAMLAGAQGKAGKVQSLIPKETSSAPALPGGPGSAPGSPGMPGGASGGPGAPAPGSAAPVSPVPVSPTPAPSGGGK